MARTKALAPVVTLFAFVVRHWAALVFLVLLLLVVFVFAPRQMFEAILACAIIGTGVVVGHWWA